MNKAATNFETTINTASPVVTYACHVIAVTSLSANTFQVELQSPDGVILDYHAGQHLQLDLDINSNGKSQSLFYSIANGFDPEQPRRLQLFIQNNSERSDGILKHLTQISANNTPTQVTLPMGHAYLQTDLSLPHIFIAAGSGIAKIRCLTEDILRRQPNADVTVYWSNKKADDFYLLDEFRGWVEESNHVNFTPLLESANEDWQGRSGYLYELIEQDFNNLNHIQMYLCGSPQMVYGTIDKLQTIGLKEDNCYSDAFEYAPRN